MNGERNVLRALLLLGTGSDKIFQQARERGCGGRLRSDDARGMNPLLYQAELHRDK